MTTLSTIRVIETRLHSHMLEWSDIQLQNELLFLLDEIQDLHAELDKRDTPKEDMQGNELSLKQRIKLLASHQSRPDSSAKPVQTCLL